MSESRKVEKVSLMSYRVDGDERERREGGAFDLPKAGVRSYMSSSASRDATRSRPHGPSGARVCVCLLLFAVSVYRPALFLVVVIVSDDLMV
jgi:hypothetical protein